jgi:2-polyprenyl-3-methyl-5-hydroxy-6-metoxy-1,4-benzoquinol methylase
MNVPPAEKPVSEDFYARYDEFKGWSETPVPIAPEIFANLLDLAGATGQLRILEMGFGDGAFLDWARNRGHSVIGSEIRPEAIEAAKARGHEVYQGVPAIEPVDLIVALDVLEHLTIEQLLEFLATAEQLLKPDGSIVARFPNGSSPFFGHYQHGDATHQRPLTAALLQQIAILRGFQVAKASNPRPIPSGTRSAVKAWLAYRARDLFEVVLGYAYFGCRIPMDPNIVVVLRRAGSR